MNNIDCFNTNIGSMFLVGQPLINLKMSACPPSCAIIVVISIEIHSPKLHMVEIDVLDSHEDGQSTPWLSQLG